MSRRDKGVRWGFIATALLILILIPFFLNTETERNAAQVWAGTGEPDPFAGYWQMVRLRNGPLVWFEADGGEDAGPNEPPAALFTRPLFYDWRLRSFQVFPSGDPGAGLWALHQAGVVDDEEWEDVVLADPVLAEWVRTAEWSGLSATITWETATNAALGLDQLLGEHSAWQPEAEAMFGDVDGDGQVDVQDMAGLIVLLSFGGEDLRDDPPESTPGSSAGGTTGGVIGLLCDLLRWWCDILRDADAETDPDLLLLGPEEICDDLTTLLCPGGNDNDNDNGNGNDNDNDNCDANGNVNCNDNGGGNTNGNDNADDNTNWNFNFNFNDNTGGNDNGNDNANTNDNDDGNANDNTGGNENGNDNADGNVNDNGKGNVNANDNTDDNTNFNINANSNDNTGGNDNKDENGNENGNSNDNGNANGNGNGNSNGNDNEGGNGNGNANGNSNVNDNTWGDNDNTGGENENTNMNTNANDNANMNDNTPGGPGGCSATLDRSPGIIPAHSAWPEMPGWTYSDITVRWDPPSCKGRLVIRSVEPSNGGVHQNYQPPGQGVLERINATWWRYHSFEEPRSEIYPGWVRVTIAAMHRDQVLDEMNILVLPVHDWWVSVGHQHGPDGPRHPPDHEDFWNDYKYLRWKYAQVFATVPGNGFRGGVKISTENCVDCNGRCVYACTHGNDMCEFGRSTFLDSENVAASIIGHELAHTPGDWINENECTAYTWEVQHQGQTGIDRDNDAYLQDVLDNQRRHCR